MYSKVQKPGKRLKLAKQRASASSVPCFSSVVSRDQISSVVSRDQVSFGVSRDQGCSGVNREQASSRSVVSRERWEEEIRMSPNLR